MKGDPRILQHLNIVLRNELAAINQYFLHSRMFGNWGLKRLERHEYQESIDEMKHADQLIARLLFLEGKPNMVPGKLMIGSDVREMLANDLGMEQAAHADLRLAIADSEAADDFVSRELFRGILVAEEEHIDWLETQLDLIERIGLQNYCQSQLLTPD
jgi:bacterioferritin